MGHELGRITRPFDFAEVAALIGESKLDGGTLCTSPKINPRSRYKPYKFGSYDTLLIDKNGNENPILRENNFGMTPSTIGWNPYRALPWILDAAPKAGMHWLRDSDFDHYSQYAAGGISTARIYTNNPRDDRKIMLGGWSEGQEGKIIGEVIYSFDPRFEILPEDFKHPDDSNLSLGDFRFTLLFGPIQNNDSAFSQAPWVSQSSISIKEMQHSDGGTNYEKLEIIIDSDMSRDLMNWTGPDDFLTILCLAPPIVKNANGLFSRWQIGSNQGNRLGFDDMRLVSLDMWGDSTVQQESVLIMPFGYWDEWGAPDPSKLPEEVIAIAPTKEKLSNPNAVYQPFECRVTYGGFFVDGNGRQGFSIDVDPFSDIWFDGKSKIGKLSQYLECSILDSSNRLVKSYDKLISTVDIGTPYNPTQEPYSIGFEKELAGGEIFIDTLPKGQYTLRIRVRVEQVGYTVRYVNGKGYRQVMYDFYWEDDEKIFEGSDEGMVYAVLNGENHTYKDFKFTIY